jgi:hypothetical protein
MTMAINETTRMLDTLPKPPAKPWTASKAQLMTWLQEVARVGGVDGLNWAFNPSNWPGTPQQRAHLISAVGELRREIQERQKEELRRKAEEQANAGRDAVARSFAERGWERWQENQ